MCEKGKATDKGTPGMDVLLQFFLSPDEVSLIMFILWDKEPINLKVKEREIWIFGLSI